MILAQGGRPAGDVRKAQDLRIYLTATNTDKTKTEGLAKI